ncbi:MAG: citrate lyase holo-[acyl-carrier protein] synthase [Clostridia bacterium]
MKINIDEMLNAREQRVINQRALSNRFNSAVISFTMNMAGEIKSFPLLRRAFLTGVSMIRTALPNIIYSSVIHLETGDEGYFAVQGDPETIKAAMVKIEDSFQLGRLFDIDVLNTAGEKMTREKPRRCLICNEIASVCARSRNHGLNTIISASMEILYDYFSSTLAKCAYDALICEVEATPKPGLVDRNNTGAHSDMGLPDFYASASSLFPHFKRMARFGIENANADYKTLMLLLSEEGKRAERSMLNATGGVNTHRGAIFTIGLLLASFSKCFTTDRDDVLQIAANLAAEHFKTAVRNPNGSSVESDFGISGIKSESVSGFPSVLFAFNKFKDYLTRGFSDNDAAVFTLLDLLPIVSDTNILHRAGISGYKYMINEANKMLSLSKEDRFSAALSADADFIKRNLSPGGCADILSAGIFLNYVSDLPH